MNSKSRFYFICALLVLSCAAPFPALAQHTGYGCIVTEPGGQEVPNCSNKTDCSDLKEPDGSATCSSCKKIDECAPLPTNTPPPAGGGGGAGGGAGPSGTPLPNPPINPNLPISSPVPVYGPLGKGPAAVVANFYTFAFGIAGFLAFIMIIYGGARYAFSAGNHSAQSDAKDAIKQALLGLGLLLVGFLILQTINPDLTTLKLPTLAPYVAPTSTTPAQCGGGMFGICPGSQTCKQVTSTTPGASTTFSCVAGTATTGNCTGSACSDSNINVCAPNTSASCAQTQVNQWDSYIRAAAAHNQIGSGINTVAMLKAIMSQESHGDPNAASAAGAFGAFQLLPSTANANRAGCTTDNITSNWLRDPHNMQANACVVINFIRSLVSSCGSDPADLAAGYNGGGSGQGACNLSTSCKSCSMCGGKPTRRWACPWEGPDGEHLSCNVDRAGGSFHETRNYAPKVAYCYNTYAGI